MSAIARERPVVDVSGLPTVVFGNRSTVWLATVGLMAIEGTMFVLALVSYLYLRTRVTQWPPGINPPEILWGTLNLALFILSGIPNYMAARAAEKGQLGKVRVLLVVMCLFAIGNMALRAFEFPALNCQWDQNAYASIVWFILGVHTTHLITDFLDTFVLTAMFFGGTIEGKRFMDVSENALYWWFVVSFWVPVYIIIYWAPRWL